MRFSVLIPVRSLDAPPDALSALPAVRHPPGDVEVLLAEGNNPSRLRNILASRASGDILYFLDDDARLDTRAMMYLEDYYEERPEIAGIGGPSLPSLTDRPFSGAARIAMVSIFGLGPAAHRYYPAGPVRPGGDTELILCNLSVRKRVWDHHSGFDEQLYPNEENEYLARLHDAKERFLYHPLVIVHRPPRDTFSALCLQMLRYGIGRTRHLRRRRSRVSLLFFAPTLFVLYLFALAGALLATMLAPEACGWLAHPWAQAAFAAPLGLYIALTCAASFIGVLATPWSRPMAFLRLLAVFPAIHLSYGVGSIVSWLLPMRERKPWVGRIVRWKAFDTPYPSPTGATWLDDTVRLDVSDAFVSPHASN